MSLELKNDQKHHKEKKKKKKSEAKIGLLKDAIPCR